MKLLSLCYLIVLLLCCSTGATASIDKHDLERMEREATIWRELEAVAPEAVEVFKHATVAADTANIQAASALYRQVLELAPGFHHAQRRLGFALLSAGDVDKAYILLDSAVESKRTSENLFALAYMLAEYSSEGSVDEVTRGKRALPLAREATITMKWRDVDYPTLYAQCALQANNEAELRNATGILQNSYPGERATHFFSAIVASIDEEWTTAHDEILLAVDKGFDPDAAATFLDESGVGTQVATRRYFSWFLYALALWGAGLVFLFAAGRTCSSIILRFIENGDPNAMAGDRENRLRKLYKKLITATGVYYYISLPIVALSVLLLAAGFTFATFAVGRIPIYIVIAVDFGALATVFYMVQTLFTKPRIDDPGRKLLPDEAPDLWTLTRNVALAVGTRPIDEIRVVPGTDLAVYERGSARERAEDRASRVLVLGVGILNGFDKNGFRSVLAHEYGHFSHRDTAGGDVAMRVSQNMEHLLIAMFRGGQTTWWNLGFWFLRFYIVLFRRISHGATRLQEVMADRVAVLHYGAAAFRNGLTHVIRRDAEFSILAVREINSAYQQQRPLRNIYDMQIGDGDSEERLLADSRVQQVLAATTDHDDTHPAPVDRFRLADRVHSMDVEPLGGDVWSFFAARAEITKEMNQKLREQANASGAVAIPIEQ